MRKEVFEQRAAEMRARLQADRERTTPKLGPRNGAGQEPPPVPDQTGSVPGLPSVEPHQLLERIWKPAYTKALLTTLPKAHSLVIQSAQHVGKSQVGFDGLLCLGGEGGLDLNVSLPRLAQALQLYDLLIRSIADRGGSIALAREGTMVSLDGETERIRLREGTIRRLKRQPERSYGDYTYDATGVLYFVLLEDGTGKCKTAIGRDADVADFLGKVRAVFARRPLARAEREERQRQWQAEQQRRAEQERLEAEAQQQWKEQQQRFDALYKDVTRWQKAAQIRAYVTAFIQEHEHSRGPVVPGSAPDGWLRWVQWYADQLDPFTSSDGPSEDP